LRRPVEVGNASSSELRETDREISLEKLHAE
jgi:hypothetical protein